MSTPFAFTVLDHDPECAARVGRITTPHGAIDTPVFMPVGTQATVKAVSQDDLRALDAPIILGNAYHLYLRPGTAIIEEAGGLHRFMNWDRALLTDSGGFQVFSLAQLNKVTEDGVAFQSHIDGSRHFFSPESATDIQIAIGADIIMCFDECTSYPVEHGRAAESMEITLRWARRCQDRWRERGADAQQALFGIVQGSVYTDLRGRCADALAALDFPGYAIGGVSVGEPKEDMHRIMAETAAMLPVEKPRYVMGVGTPEDLLAGIEAGVDMFDCVMPTRNARNGALFTSEGRINIKNTRFRTDFAPLDPACQCLVCSRYTRAYLSHLYHAGEILSLCLNTLHNLAFMIQLTDNCRDAIRAGRYRAFKQAFLERYEA